MKEKTIHILLVEDEEAHAELVRRAFESQANHVHLTVAGSLQEAREYLAGFLPDLVIADLLLPDGRGIELLPAREEKHSFPVVVMTSHGDEHVAVEAMKAGALDYVVKSEVALSDMPHIVERALREWGHITERVRAEKALQESEERYRNLVESSPDMIYTLDTQGDFTFVNSRSKDIIGYTPEELIGKNGFQYIHPEDVERVRDAFQSSLESGTLLPYFGWRTRHKDGTYRHHYTTATFIRNSDGDIVGYQGITKDITDYKKMEEELVRTERLRALGDMASGVAHNFNNLLMGVLGYAEIMKKETNLAEIKRGLETIETAALRGKKLVKRLQDFTQIRWEKPSGSVDLNRVILESIRMARMRLKELESKGIKIEVVHELGEIPLIKGEESELEEIITNMIFNSIDAMPEGGKLTLKTEGMEDFVYLYIKDTGVGMTDEVKRRIFEPFFTTKEEVGAGVGLSMAYGIINRYGGSIDAGSALGEGTTLTVKLPTYSAVPKAPEAQEVKGGKILIIDEDEMILDVLGRILEDYEVEAVSDSEEGLNLFREGRHDVIVVEMAMHGMNGWELAEAAREIDPCVSVVMCVGWDVKVSRKELKESSVDFLLKKPAGGKEVREVVEQAVQLTTETRRAQRKKEQIVRFGCEKKAGLNP